MLVDVQRDFLDPSSLPQVGSWRKAFCVPGIERLLDVAPARGWTVIHVGTEHRGPETLPAHHRRRGLDVYCVAGSPGVEFIVPPRAGDTVLRKTWYSAFGPELTQSLGDVSTIIWGGVATDCCIQQSAFEADRRGLHSVIPIQAVSASSADAFAASLGALAKSAATVVDLAAVLDGGDVPSAGIEPTEVGQRAKDWFTAQESTLGDTTGLSLDEVLCRLRAGTGSA